MDRDPFKRKCIAEQHKKVLIIPQNEFRRIVHNARALTSKLEHEDTIREARKQKLKEAKELAEKIAQRKEVGSELKQRQYAIETELARDELEVEARLLARKDRVLDKAYKRLFEQTDRVKYFNAAKDLAVMMKERDDQVAKKAAQQDMFAKYDAEFLDGMLKDVDRYNDEEDDKKRVKEENKRKDKENWIKQHGEVLQKRDKEKLENLREGYLIRNEVEEDKLKDKQKAQQEREGIKNYKNSLDHQIRDKCHLFDVHQTLEEVKEAKAELFNDFKRQVKLEHKQIKARLNKEKDSKRQYVAENMADDTIGRRTKEEANLQKAVRQAEEKSKEEDAVKKLKREEEDKAFKEFYNKEMSAKRRREFEDRLREYQESRKIVDNIDKLKKIEDSKSQRHYDLENEAQHIQLHQIAKCRADKRSEEIETIKDYMEHMRGLDEEEEMFQKYAQMEIDQCESQGIDTYAMKKASRPGIECGKGLLFKDRGHIRPRYYSAVGSGIDLVHMHRKPKIEDTKSRLGFTLY